MQSSILWHDYETWGVDPQKDFPAQFAAIRTDENLNIIAKPINWFCQIPNDYLPNPEACLVTGITPQASLERGFIEVEFANKVLSEMSKPGTCSAGYNSLRFDDEMSRRLFYRNFLPIYDREYKNANSRWDIIDLVRATYALRPDGIEWPHYDDGKPCFKLDQLTPANGIEHEDAHDALSDVYATIEIAKLIKKKQAKLYDWYWHSRDKHTNLSRLNLQTQKPFVYISAFIPSTQGCCSVLQAICVHPQNKNAIICVDLNKPIENLFDTNPERLADLLKDPDTIDKPGIHLVKINQCPFIAPLNVLSKSRAEELGIDLNACATRHGKLNQDHQIHSLLSDFYARDLPELDTQNTDKLIYARGFPSPSQLRWQEKIRSADPYELQFLGEAADSILDKQQLFKYQGRNFPFSFDESMQARWQEYRINRLQNGEDCLSIEQYSQTIQTLLQAEPFNQRNLNILKKLEEYLGYL